MSDFNRDDWVKRIVRPEFGDAMNFQIEKQIRDDDQSYSMEAVDGMVDQMKTFILGRTLAAWKGGKGEPPRDLLATLKLSFKAHPKEVLELGLPWWGMVDTVDGKHRRTGRKDGDDR